MLLCIMILQASIPVSSIKMFVGSDRIAGTVLTGQPSFPIEYLLNSFVYHYITSGKLNREAAQRES